MKQDIQQIDANFKNSKVSAEIVFTAVRETAATVEALHDKSWVRLPSEILSEIDRPGLTAMADCSTGGVVRFATQSKRIAVRMQLAQPELLMPHMPLTGSSGIDVFVNGSYRATWRPQGCVAQVEGELALEGNSEITLYLPLYNGVAQLFLGVLPDATIDAPVPYQKDIPIVYYGSSIVQGGCASRPSNAYPALVSRWLGRPFRCLGFSGNAKGDLPVADYIAGLHMSALVYDYDHNAPSAEVLEQTHLPFLLRILQKHPTLPVLILSKTDLHPWNPEREDIARQKVIEKTWRFCKEKGYNVVFQNGGEIFEQVDRDCCTVDTVHPNDLGFYCMAKCIYAHLHNLLS